MVPSPGDGGHGSPGGIGETVLGGDGVTEAILRLERERDDAAVDGGFERDGAGSGNEHVEVRVDVAIRGDAEGVGAAKRERDRQGCGGINQFDELPCREARAGAFEHAEVLDGFGLRAPTAGDLAEGGSEGAVAGGQAGVNVVIAGGIRVSVIDPRGVHPIIDIEVREGGIHRSLAGGEVAEARGVRGDFGGDEIRGAIEVSALIGDVIFIHAGIADLAVVTVRGGRERDDGIINEQAIAEVVVFGFPSEVGRVEGIERHRGGGGLIDAVGDTDGGGVTGVGRQVGITHAPTGGGAGQDEARRNIHTVQGDMDIRGGDAIGAAGGEGEGVGAAIEERGAIGIDAVNAREIGARGDEHVEVDVHGIILGGAEGVGAIQGDVGVVAVFINERHVEIG